MIYVKLKDVLHIVDTVSSDKGIRKKCKAIRKRLKELPAKDVEKVVRCKDCDFGKSDDESGVVLCSCRNAPWDNKYVDYFAMSPFDYCSFGVRKEGVKNE